MRSQLLFPLFISFALLIISSKETRNEQLPNDIQSSQSITLDSNSDCIITELSFSLKDNFSRPTFYEITYKSHFEKRKCNRIDLVANDLKLYRKKTIVFIPLIQRFFIRLLHYSLDNKDDITS